jgi:hypothetical protein
MLNSPTSASMEMGIDGKIQKHECMPIFICKDEHQWGPLHGIEAENGLVLCVES